MRYVLPTLALAACSAEYGFHDVSSPEAAPTAAAPATYVAPGRTGPRRPAGDTVRFERVDVKEGPTAAVTSREDRVRKVREDVFAAGGGASSPVADYLFVVDHSVSMDKVLGNVQQGMLSLAADGVFPTKARIAVMTTLPADPTTPVGEAPRPHAAATPTPGLAFDPGFLGLVSEDRIQAYVDHASPEIAERFPMRGCDAWFDPAARNDAGQPCLLAHTQIGSTGVGVEAGLIAFRQLVERAEAPLFRPGAAVNVVFVSDTHDPGIPLDAPGAEGLRELRPDVALLRELVMANSLVSSFRVHAIAPARACVERWSDGPTYREAARAGDGVFLDVCTATDYRPLIEEIARKGAVVQQPVFPLGRSAAEVESVAVDGSPVGFSVSEDGGVVVLDQALPRRRARVHVRYVYE